jgi:hypothetical protein
LNEVFSPRQSTVLAGVISEAYDDLVRSKDFNELKEIVRTLAEAQVHTEQRVDELVVAQQRTEQRVEELAVAQQDLTKAQQRTEQRVEELVVAQQRTERALGYLARQVGGLSNRLGSDLEDVAYAAVRDVLKRELGWNVGSLGPSWQQWNGKKEEVDILGTATDPSRPHEKIWIVGEVKFNLTVKDVERFAKKVSRARNHLTGELLPVCFCYRARTEVEEAATRNGIRMVYSYGRFV